MRLQLTLFFCLIQALCMAQRTETQAFPITDYMVPSGDSIMIVQIDLPEKLLIKENTMGVLQPKWSEEDTLTYTNLGLGRCHLIKSNYHYYGIKLTPGLRKPKAGDLIYTQVVFPSLYSSLLQSISTHYISFLNAYGDPLFPMDSVWHHNNAATEIKFMDRLVEEVRFVGKVMQEENNQQDRLVEEGPYAGKKLFDLMVNGTTRVDMEKFLRYIDARPAKYAGHAWSISEIYATWIVSGAPTVIK